MTQIRIDLYSDTKTRPVPEMRRAIAEAVVGDEQHHDGADRACRRPAWAGNRDVSAVGHHGE